MGMTFFKKVKNATHFLVSAICKFVAKLAYQSSVVDEKSVCFLPTVF